MAAIISVSMKPGAIALTVTPFRASSSAADFVADDARLGRRVVGLPEIAMDADHGADVDDSAIARLDHVRQHPGGHVEDAAQVRLEDVVPLLAGHLGQAAVAGDPGVIDEHVDLAEALEDARDRGLDRIGSWTSQPNTSDLPPDVAISSATSSAAAASWA